MLVISQGGYKLQLLLLLYNLIKIADMLSYASFEGSVIKILCYNLVSSKGIYDTNTILVQVQFYLFLPQNSHNINKQCVVTE